MGRKTLVGLALAALVAGTTVHSTVTEQAKLEAKERIIKAMPTGFQSESTWTLEGVRTLMKEFPCAQENAGRLKSGLEYDLGQGLRSQDIAEAYDQSCDRWIAETKRKLESFTPDKKVYTTPPNKWDEETREALGLRSSYAVNGGADLSNEDVFTKLRSLNYAYHRIDEIVDVKSVRMAAKNGWFADDDFYINTLKNVQASQRRLEICANDHPVGGRAQSCLRRMHETYGLQLEISKARGDRPKFEVKSTSFDAGHLDVFGSPESSEFCKTNISKEGLYK